MKIYSMTATFGKLEHETLTLRPGLNIIQAPNEWGKSTWCAFLVSMLYGMETRAKTTKTVLADKERYAPWSGSPMAGRIDLNWNGRDITIERKTKRRVPLGDFRAYETASGLEIPELTAANCGAMLLGVERSVFLRAGFIRFSDLPVTQDEALRRRLNDLVTTGDESGTADQLAKGLRELKNRCRYNKSGLLPQAESQRGEVEAALQEIAAGAQRQENLKQRMLEVRQELKNLENHRDALDYQTSLEDAARVAQAEKGCEEAKKRLQEAQNACRNLPGEQDAWTALTELNRLEKQLAEVRREIVDLGPAPGIPSVEPMTLEALQEVSRDCQRYAQLNKPRLLLPVLGAMVLLGSAVLALWTVVGALAAAATGLVLMAFGLVHNRKRHNQAEILAETYGSRDPDQWMRDAREKIERMQKLADQAKQYRVERSALDRRERELGQELTAVTGGKPVEDCRWDWDHAMKAWKTLQEAQMEYDRLASGLASLRSMVRILPPPAQPDTLVYTAPQTEHLLAQTRAEQHRLENLLGQAQGRAQALGSPEELEREREKLDRRIARLEDVYAALTIAQETLAQATAELQRRFAPRIAQQAQEMMGILTAGRYDRLALAEDLSVRSGAEREDTLHEILWRSDGTMDQLYLSLRLAVARELTPQAPLILDDALVRFDDTRLKAALEFLGREAEEKQVILFTCQSREKEILQ